MQFCVMHKKLRSVFVYVCLWDTNLPPKKFFPFLRETNFMPTKQLKHKMLSLNFFLNITNLPKLKCTL